jgi:hypothetical protein
MEITVTPISQDYSLKTEMKKAKQPLCKAQRESKAETKRQTLQDIMDKQHSDFMFHKLRRNQRSTNSNTTKSIVVQTTKLTASEEILQSWACHFEHLATPKQDD